MFVVLRGAIACIGLGTSTALAVGLVRDIARERCPDLSGPQEVARPEVPPESAYPPPTPAKSSKTQPKRDAPTSKKKQAAKSRQVYRVTAYCDPGTTASGTKVGVGQCAAPAHIPFGARVHIPALNRTFVVTDRTAPRFRHNTVDIFMPREDICRDFGRRYLRCEVTLPNRT